MRECSIKNSFMYESACANILPLDICILGNKKEEQQDAEENYQAML